MKDNITAIIPARGGSKGIPKKNLKLLMGKPLIVWTIEAAIKSKSFKNIIVSTDDPHIAKVAKEAGAEVPFLRPNYLATDQIPIINTILDILNKENNIKDIMLLQPTSPLRSSQDIRNIIKLRDQYKKDSAISIVEAKKHPNLSLTLNKLKIKKFINNSLILPRQQMEKTYLINGAMYLSTREFILDKKDFYGEETLGYIMPEERSVDIDNYIDFDWAEFLIKRYN
jgi:CMP-N-acetylneuraminic acid synthetase